MESSTPLIELTNINTTLEHKPVLYEQEYHNSQIRIVEFDHQQSKLAGKEYVFPNDWREKLKKEFDGQKENLVALEYCLPDLWKYAKFELLALGYNKGLGKSDTRSDHTTEIYGYLGRLAGQERGELIAADPANEAVWVIFEGGGGAENPLLLPSPAALTQHIIGNVKYGPETFSYFDYGNINDREINEGFIVDTRRLLTARGIMQKALQKKRSITLFTAPVHAERIANYVERQRQFEADSGQTVEKPKDFGSVTPNKEAEKMITYGRWPLHRNIRVYSPILSPESFKFDLFLHDSPVAADEKRRDSKEYLRETSNQMKLLLSNKPTTSREKWYFERVKTAQKLLDIFLKSRIINSNICESVRNEIWSFLSTDRYGWVLAEKNKIY